jgi:hypothetical protein
MKYKLKLVLVVIFIITIITIVFGKSLINTQVGNFESNSTKTKLSCNKEENCCVTNDDCKYIWFTGACNTSEYVTKIQKEAEAEGKRSGEAPPREDVTCSCESNKCVTHN